MKALVTGASGFIGANVVRALLTRGHEVRALVRAESDRGNLRGLRVDVSIGDLRDPASLRSAVGGCDALFHVAAAYAFWTPNPAAVYQINVEGTRNILTAARDADIKKIVYTSTESTIGRPGTALGVEEDVAPEASLYGHYKRSKLLAEIEVLSLCRRGWPITIVNPTMPLGPWDVKPTPTGQVVVDFLNGRMPAYVNTGLNVVDVRDVAEGHVLAFERGRIGERYILGSLNLTLCELLEILADTTGRKAPTARIPIGIAIAAGAIDEFVRGRLLKKPPRIPLAAVRTARKFRHFDCTKAIEELGLPQSPIEKALKDAVGWFRSNGYVRA